MIIPSFALCRSKTLCASGWSIAFRKRDIPDLNLRTQDDAEGAKFGGGVRMSYGSQPDMTGVFSSPTTSSLVYIESLIWNMFARYTGKLPEGYKPPQVQNLRPNVDGDLVLTGGAYGRRMTMLYTTQPPSLNDDDPDGQSECYMTPATKQQLLATNNYPQPLRQYSSPAFRIGPAGHCGLGMFATRTIRNGEYICTERPIMVMPAATTAFGEVSPALAANMTYGSMQKIVLAERELAHEVMFKRLKPKQQEEYMSLANWYVFQGHGFQRRALR